MKNYEFSFIGTQLPTSSANEHIIQAFWYIMWNYFILNYLDTYLNCLPFFLWWFSHSVMSDSCDPMDCSPPVSSVHRFYRQEWILQARILEWVAISFSRGSPQPRIEPASSAWQADSLPLNHPGSPTGHYDIEYNFKQHKEAYLMN